MEPLVSAILATALLGSSLLAYALRILDAKGATAAFLLGGLVLLVGGLPWFSLMVVFTALAFLSTRFGRRTKLQHGTAEARDGERGAPNVIANGAAPAIAVLLAHFVDPTAGAWAYLTAVAAITADTLASEIGGLSANARRILPPWARTGAGVNGSVSLLGQVAAAAGALAVTASAVPIMGMSWTSALVTATGGFMGSQVDSVLGATLEHDDTLTDRPLSKGAVNFLSSTIVTVVVFVVVLWTSL